MTFDELMNYLTDKREQESPELEEQAAELVVEVLNVGADVLNRLPKERIAGMMSLAQTAAFQAAIMNNEFDVAAFTQIPQFTDALVYVFQATTGILTMEEVH